MKLLRQHDWEKLPRYRYHKKMFGLLTKPLGAESYFHGPLYYPKRWWTKDDGELVVIK